MKIHKFLFFVLLALAPALYGAKFTLSGYIRDASTGEELLGATVMEKGSYVGTATNSYGYFSLALDSGGHTLVFAYLGYQTFEKTIQLTKDIYLEMELVPEEKLIQEVVITAKKETDPLQSKNFAIEQLDSKALKELPSIYGENDVIKALQLTSGVTTLGEGSTGMFVQGGNHDQNLIIIDEAPVYNASHLYGLISVFNPDAIKDVKFYKSAMPAKYGGKLSSVVSCKMNEGNMKKASFSGSLGTYSGRLAVEGPIKKDTASYLIALRRSFRDLALNYIKVFDFIPEFYDMNLKINWRVNQNNRLFLSFYHGLDQINSRIDLSNTWDNTTSTFRWNHTFSPKLFSNLSVIYSNYNNQWDFENVEDYYWNTGVRDLALKYNFTWFINPSNKMEFGSENIHHQYQPGQNQYPEQSIPGVNAIENALYWQHETDLKPWLGINYGLRLSLFQNIGEATWYVYEDYLPSIKQTNEKGVYNTYRGTEPRVILNLKPSKNHVFKLAYTKNYQYSQVLQNSIFSFTSLQSWLPSNPSNQPMRANMYSLGYYWGLPKYVRFSAEGYFKQLYNIADYVDHAQLISNPYIETQIRRGTGEAKGVSFETSFTSDKLYCNFSYIYSRIQYTIPGINHGDVYNALQDVPHDFRALAKYQFLRHFTFHAFWTWHTGYVATFPNSYVLGRRVPIYNERNSDRLPDYHRLDLSLLFELPKKHRRVAHSFKASVYNVYARFNPAGYMMEEIESGKIRLFTFFRVLPAGSYSFKF